MSLKQITFKLDPLGTTDIYGRLNIMQYDHLDTSFIATLYIDDCFSSNLNLLNYETAVANYRLPDGTTESLPCNFLDRQNGILEIILTRDITSKVGNVRMEIVLEDIDTEEVLVFNHFKFYVSRNPIGDVVNN